MIAVRFDDRQRLICLGDTVKVLYVDHGRGAYLWMDTGVVAGFARTRVLVKFPSRTAPQGVGAECLRVLA